MEVDTGIRALTVGQYAVFFQGDELMGSAMMTHIGLSFHDQGVAKISPQLRDLVITSRKAYNKTK